jgi:hypothetical protein
MSLPARFQEFRTTERFRWTAMVAAILVGLVASSIHWIGLFLGGALCGLVSATRKRALLSGLGFGILVWGVFALSLFASGDFGQYLAMGQLFVVSVAIPVVAATFAALVRWLV